MAATNPETNSDGSSNLTLTRRDMGRAGVATVAAVTVGANPVAGANYSHSLYLDAYIPPEGEDAGVNLEINVGDGGISNTETIDETQITSELDHDGNHRYEGNIPLTEIHEDYETGDEMWIEGNFFVDENEGTYPVIYDIEIQNEFDIHSAILEIDADIPHQRGEAEVLVYSSEREINDPIGGIEILDGKNYYELNSPEFVTEDAEIWLEGEFEFTTNADFETASQIGINSVNIIPIGDDPGGLDLSGPEEAEDVVTDLGPELPSITPGVDGYTGILSRTYEVIRELGKYLSFLGLLVGGSVWIIDQNENRSAAAYATFKMSLVLLILYFGWSAMVSVMRYIAEGVGV